MKIELDEGYHFGLGLFETMKVANGKVLFLQEHIDRLRRSLETFQIKQEINIQMVLDYVSNQKEKDFICKLQVSEKNVIFTKREDFYRNRDIFRGWKLKISSVLRNSTSPLVYHKTLCYGENILEYRRSKELGYDEVLFKNERGDFTEGSLSNVFFCLQNKLLTPKLTNGLLAGTMREHLLKHYESMEVEELNEDIVSKCDACFVCNSAMGISWVEWLENIHFHKTPFVEQIILDLQKLGF